MNVQPSAKKALNLLLCLVTALVWVVRPGIAVSDDLTELKRSGVLRHIGVPYANFIRKTPTGYDGLDVELMHLFADIKMVKSLLNGQSVLTIDNTCLAADLYRLEQTRADIKHFTRSHLIDDLVDAMIKGPADTTLLDIPDAMVTLPKWPGQIKIIGPVSENQVMGVAVSKSSPQILSAFHTFFQKLWNDGVYRAMVEKYYPSVFLYFEMFFDRKL